MLHCMPGETDTDVTWYITSGLHNGDTLTHTAKGKSVYKAGAAYQARHREKISAETAYLTKQARKTVNNQTTECLLITG